ncbi:hypothetical protein [Nostoc sp.]|uniref:hypothetical protein n=1 Tax=Nostoc sp. TaxID=1180 RepID=UPI002FFB530C
MGTRELTLLGAENAERESEIFMTHLGLLYTEQYLVYTVALPKRGIKGFPRNKLSILWDGHLARPNIGDGQDAHPTRKFGIFFYLEVPKVRNLCSMGYDIRQVYLVENLWKNLCSFPQGNYT